MTTAENAAPQRSLGDEIRQLRQAKGLTLRELADRCQRSFSYLGQIERGNVQPSLATVKSIAQALGIEVTWFFPPDVDADGRELGVVVRSQSRRRLSFAYSVDTEALGYEDYLLSGSLDLDLCMGLARISPGGSTNAEPKTYNQHLCGYVAKGKLALDLDGETFTLYEGDSFSFDARRPHNVSNPGESVAELVWSVSPTRLEL